MSLKKCQVIWQPYLHPRCGIFPDMKTTDEFILEDNKRQ